MKIDFSVLQCNEDGSALVEYNTAELGRVSKSIFIPLNHSPEIQLSEIIRQFPAQVFHSRLLQLQAKKKRLEPAHTKGAFTYILDEPFEDPYGVFKPTPKV